MSVQRGFAMIALLALAALIAAFLIASGLNITSAGNSNEREDRSMNALRKAKAALIAYAASEQWQAYKGQTTNQPGGLPCPDNNDTGASPGICSAAADRVGRLPWATIGGEDLRDASGERLWYAVSSNFYKNAANIINSDTQGLLTVTGAAPASNVVAVVIAPGAALSGQDRVAQHNDPAAYLEGVTANTPDYGFSTVAVPSDTANDRLLAITQADLMAAVEPVVAARIERDVKPLLKDYYNKWFSYPFAVPFPPLPIAQSAYVGASPQTSGLLPVTNTATLTWQNPPTVTQIPPGDGSPTVTSSSCSISSLTATCTVNYCCNSGDRPDIRIEVLLANSSMAFADKPAPITDADNLAMLDGNGDTPTNQSPPYGYWSAAGSPPRVPTGGTFVAQVGGWTLTYTGRLQNASSMNHQATITIPLPAPGYLSKLDPVANPSIAWFLSNQWYRQTYYAVSSGLTPGGAGSCSQPPATPPPPLCLTVKNLPSPTNDKQAILVFFGRALDGQTRPGTLANYLEGENSTPADFIYEHRAGLAGFSCAQFATGTCPVPNAPYFINDRVVVISPP